MFPLVGSECESVTQVCCSQAVIRSLWCNSTLAHVDLCVGVAVVQCLAVPECFGQQLWQLSFTYTPLLFLFTLSPRWWCLSFDCFSPFVSLPPADRSCNFVSTLSQVRYCSWISFTEGCFVTCTVRDLRVNVSVNSLKYHTRLKLGQGW